MFVWLLYISCCVGNSVTTTSSVVALSTPVHPHSRLMANTRHGMEVLTCCTPAKLSGVSILYVNTHGLIIKSNLPNMVVGSCGCA